MRTDSTGSIALISGEQEIEASIRIVLATARGERPMRPEFGCGIHDFTFAPTSASTIGRIAQEVRTALARWEPRIDVADVEVIPDEDDPARLSIQVFYSIRRTNDPRNLVFPFYVLPNERRRPAKKTESTSEGRT